MLVRFTKTTYLIMFLKQCVAKSFNKPCIHSYSQSMFAIVTMCFSQKEHLHYIITCFILCKKILNLKPLKFCILCDLEEEGKLVSHSKSSKLSFRRRLQLVLHNGSIVLSLRICIDFSMFALRKYQRI